MIFPENINGGSGFTPQSPETRGGMANVRQTEIPVTTPEHYITGIYALNIPSEEGTTGDWHGEVFWHPVGVREPKRISLGGTAPFDTNPVFKDMGVREARQSVTGMGLHVAEEIKEVYVANHTRAILDLLMSEITVLGNAKGLNDASSDWLDTPEQKQKLLTHAMELGTFLVRGQRAALAEWIEHEQSID